MGLIKPNYQIPKRIGSRNQKALFTSAGDVESAQTLPEAKLTKSELCYKDKKKEPDTNPF